MNYQTVETVLDFRRFKSRVTRGAFSIIDVADIILSAGSLFTELLKFTAKLDISGVMGLITRSNEFKTKAIYSLYVESI